MRAYEHRAIGDEASGAALVNLGGEGDGERFMLGFGDVIALSGDFFRPDGATSQAATSGRSGPDAWGGMFDLALVPGEAGTRPDSRDEIVCALKVATLDEAVVDPRFEPGGRFADFRFSPGADRSEVERRVRDRFLALAASNDDHFVAPGRSDSATGSGAGSALMAYRRLHQVALEEARRLGLQGGDLSRAMAREAAAQHYLTDAFAAGHLRTPVASIRRYWKARYPAFWEHLQGRVASDTAEALRELSLVLRLLPRRYLHRRTLSELTTRTSQYPQLSLGDLVARAFHDWDNTHGLVVEGGGVVFGDGHIDEGETTGLALAAVRAGKDDIDVAFSMGAAGSRLGGERLYRAVREATGADDDRFLAETRVPQLSPVNSCQNWHAADVEALWASPMVGSHGTTVGDALVAMLEPGGQFIRQVDSLGQGLTGEHGVLAIPLLGAWLSDKCCHAFHGGFVEPLAHDPERVVLALAHGGSGEKVAGRGHADRSRRRTGRTWAVETEKLGFTSSRSAWLSAWRFRHAMKRRIGRWLPSLLVSLTRMPSRTTTSLINSVARGDSFSELSCRVPGDDVENPGPAPSQGVSGRQGRRHTRRTPWPSTCCSSTTEARRRPSTMSRWTSGGPTRSRHTSGS